MKLILAACSLSIAGGLPLSAQEHTYSSHSLIETGRLSALGETPYLSLNPGHEIRLTDQSGDTKTELRLVPANETVLVTFDEPQSVGQTPCRYIE